MHHISRLLIVEEKLVEGISNPVELYRLVSVRKGRDTIVTEERGNLSCELRGQLELLPRGEEEPLRLSGSPS